MDPSTHLVEKFYESLDELDLYQNPEMGDSTDNFYIKQIKEQNEALRRSREACPHSFLYRMPWLIINPNSDT